MSEQTLQVLRNLYSNYREDFHRKNPGRSENDAELCFLVDLRSALEGYTRTSIKAASKATDWKFPE